jgi:hypothetical protein
MNIEAGKNTQPVHFLMLLVFLTAPYFYIRDGGFDFSKGNSLSLVDLFLITSLCLVGYNFLLKRFSLNKRLLAMLWVGGVFTALCLLSGITAQIFGANDNVNWLTLFSGTVQYSFIFIAFPVLAAFFLSSGNIRTAIRYIALGYMPTMLMTILLAPEAAFPDLRTMFFAVNRAIGTYGNANSFAEVLMITMPLYAYLIATEKGLWQKVGYVGLIALLVCLFLSGSFSGAIALVIIMIANVILIAVWKKHPLRGHIKSALLQLALIIFMFTCAYAAVSIYAPYIVGRVVERILPHTINSAPNHAMEITSEQSVEIISGQKVEVPISPPVAAPPPPPPTVLQGTVNTRMELNYRALDKIKERSGGLFYGHGLRQTSALPEFDFEGNGLDVHMLYLLLWAEGGFILTATFMAYLLLLFYNCVNLAKTYPAEAIAIGTSVLSLAVFCLFLPHDYLRYFWVPLLPAFITTKQIVAAK